MQGNCQNPCDLGISETSQFKLCITYVHCGTYRPPFYIVFSLFVFCTAAKGRHLGELRLQSQSHQQKRQGKPSVLMETICKCHVYWNQQPLLNTPKTGLGAEAKEVSQIPTKHFTQRHQFKQYSSSDRVTQPLLAKLEIKNPNKIALNKTSFNKEGNSYSLTPHVAAWDHHRYFKCHKALLCTEKEHRHIPFHLKQGETLGLGTRNHLRCSSDASRKIASKVTT